MQDDLFGDALPLPPANTPDHAKSRANPDLSALRGMARVLPAPAGQEWRALAGQLPAPITNAVLVGVDLDVYRQTAPQWHAPEVKS